jgi:eukaryotic-like serine/threonine-protein kinase
MPAVHGTSGSPTLVVHGYEILETLNEGGMGKIYLARQHALNRLVCVKVLSIPAGEDADLCRSLFCREAELLASVSHPHILSIFDFGATTDLGLPFLVTEYIEAGDLRGRMSGGQAMEVGQVRLIVSQVADALGHLHEKGILHRDLKPENILMPSGTRVKVGDFGIAVMQHKAGLLTQSLRGMGTVGYVSPEQQYGLKIDERTDEFSLAAVCYELLTGRRALGSFPLPSQINRRLSRQLDAVVLRGLAEEPKDRYPTVREFAAALEQALAATTRKARMLPLTIAGLIAILLGVGGFNWMTGGKSKRAIPITSKDFPNESIINPTAGINAKTDGAGKPPEPAAKTPERSPEFEQLVKLRAYVIWDRCGRPEGVAGAAVQEKNWLEAERQILDEVKARAYTIWNQQGRPEGAAGEAVREQNMREAEVQLLKETEEEMQRHPID